MDVLKILGIYFDHKLTWSSMINQSAARSYQRLGAVFVLEIILTRMVSLLLLNLLFIQYVNIVTLFLWRDAKDEKVVPHSFSANFWTDM